MADEPRAAALPVEMQVTPASGVLPDAPVIDQFGKTMRFREAVGDGAYVLSFTYTRCTEICGMADLYLSDIAERRAALPAPVRLVTLTLDPARDRPADLLERHQIFDSPDNWLRLTGDPADIMPLLTRLGVWDGTPLEDHKLYVIVGHAGRQQMARLEASPLLPDQIYDLAVRLMQ
ncbi:SCO family protein [Paracoccus sp. M683]|uniref:SCO family protein n=1 Tax=Paracoccus sp. M683 TaxID=2594268 RepID=UPI00163DAD7C|nr:SCO family protein [Paracoccus sp. M683]